MSESTRVKLGSRLGALVTLLIGSSIVACGDYAEPNDETGQAVGPGAPTTPTTPTTPITPGAAGAPAVSPPPGPPVASDPPEPAAQPPAPPAEVEVTCEMAATPCGGDLAGTWTVKDCPLSLTGEVDMAGFGLGCTTASITSGSLQVSGTFTADAAGMFTDTTVTTGMQEIEMPPSCLTVSGTVTTCDRVGGPVQSSLGYATFSCVDNAETGGCTCNGTIDQEAGLAVATLRPPEAGTYTTADNVVTVVDGRYETQYGYCATSNALVLTVAAPGKTGTVTGAIVLEKQ
jgi:hypothetical protein